MGELSQEDIEELLALLNIPVIGNNTNYWFIRTNGGANFENFYFGNYVAIGWDKLNNVQHLKDILNDDLKEIIIKEYPDDTRPGNTASQILKFVNLVKIGDYVLIPSTNCDRIAFGIITSDIYLYELTEQDKLDIMFDGIELEFLKRRDVNWITEFPLRRLELDPLLIPIIYSYGTIVDANPYSDYINRTLYDMYYREQSFHTTFNICRAEDVSAYQLYKFIDNIFTASNLYNEYFDDRIDENMFSIKASINSPGPVEIITYATGALLVLSSISLFLNGANITFSYDIFKFFKGELKIKSPGLIEKIKQLKELDSGKEKLTELSDSLSESKEKLKIKSKNKK